jgi:hypothetical protein
METLVKETKQSKRRSDKLERLKALNWDAVQRAGDIFLGEVESNNLTADDLQTLIRMQARLFEFIASAREVLDEPDSVSFAS